MKSGWLYLGEAVYQYQKKTVRKMILKDHKRPDGRADHTDPSAGSRSRHYPASSWFCDVYTWTDTDLYHDNSGSAFRGTENWTDWMSLRHPRDICIITTSRPTL